MNCLLVLLEDSGDAVAMLKRAFTQAHINNELTVFTFGKDLMLYFENDANALPDIILMDLHLPDMHGLDVLDYIRNDERLDGICVMIFTVDEDQESVIKSWKAGADAYLRKPLNIGKFLQAAQTCGIKLDIGAKE